MLEHLYNQYGKLQPIADYLHITVDTLTCKMDQLGLDHR